MYENECFDCGQVFQGGKYDRHCGCESSASPACSIAWSQNPPNEQADWWWWNGDEDAMPILVSVMSSGTNGEYFAATGQHGWNRAQWVKDMEGHWMKAVIPEPPKQ